MVQVHFRVSWFRGLGHLHALSFRTVSDFYHIHERHLHINHSRNTLQESLLENKPFSIFYQLQNNRELQDQRSPVEKLMEKLDENQKIIQDVQQQVNDDLEVHISTPV